jgi:chromosome segregation protein
VDGDGNLLPLERQLVVFPGVELTLGQPTFQALLLLDADLPDDRLPLVLEALAVTQCPADELKLPSVTSVDHIKGLQQLYGSSPRTWCARWPPGDPVVRG